MTAKWFYDNVHCVLSKALRVCVTGQPIDVNVVGDAGGELIDTSTQSGITVSPTDYTTILTYTIPVDKTFNLRQVELTMHDGAFAGIRIEKITSGPTVELIRMGILSQAHPRDTFNFIASGLEFAEGDILEIKGKVLSGPHDSIIYASYSGILGNV
jgi:hypothetical protein